MFIRQNKIYGTTNYSCPRCGLNWTEAYKVGSSNVSDTKMYLENCYSPYYIPHFEEKSGKWLTLAKSRGGGDRSDVLAFSVDSPLLKIKGDGWFIAGQKVSYIKTSPFWGDIKLIPNANVWSQTGGDRGYLEILVIEPLEADLHSSKLCKNCYLHAREVTYNRIMKDYRYMAVMPLATQTNLIVWVNEHPIQLSQLCKESWLACNIGQHEVYLEGKLRVLREHHTSLYVKKSQFWVVEGMLDSIRFSHPEHGRKTETFNPHISGTFYFIHTPPQRGGD